MMPAGEAGRRNAALEARAAARRQASSLSGSMPVIGGIAVAVVLMLAVILLDYAFDQDPHRILKVGLGVAGLGLIFVMPRFGLLVLPVVTPFLPWMPPTPVPGINVLNVLLFAIFGTYAFSRVLQRQPVIPDNHLGRVLGLILLVCALSVVRGAAFPTGYTYYAGVGAQSVFRAATSIATYFIVMAMASGPKDRTWVWWAVMIGLLAEASATVLYGRNGPGMRAVGSIGQSNDLGAFLALFAVPAFAGLAGVKNWLGRLLLAGTFVLACIATMLSLSRGSMLALVAGLVVVAWMTSRWMFGLFMVAMLLSPLWAPDYVKDRIASSQMEVEGSDEVAVDLASEARLQTWKSIWQVVQEHPLDGVGFSGLANILPDIGEGLGLEEVKDSAHNTWLRMLSETGIFGLALFVWLMWKCWRLGFDTVRLARRSFDRALGVGLCGATVTMAVSCAFGDRFFNVVIASSFWILCALAENVIAEARGTA
jgi:O-antigen ligase